MANKEELQKAEHYRSFYETARKMKDPMTRLAFYDAVDAYRFDGIEPENLPFEADLAFTAIRSFIDADCKRKTGGALTGNQNARKNKTTEKQPKNNYENNIENNQKTNKDKDKENVKEKDNGEEEEKEVFSPQPAALVLPENYATEVFNLYTKAGLPNCQGNFIFFLQRDFKFALEVLHTKPDLRGLHSDMVLGAIKNYIAVLNNPDTWKGWKNKKSFDSFVSWERFKDFLPDRFCLDNFLEYAEKKETQEVGKDKAMRIMEEMGIK